MKKKETNGAVQKYRGEIVLSAVVLSAAVLLQLYFRWNSRDPADCVVVTVDGKEVGRYLLSSDCVEEISGWEGGSNTLVIEGGCAWITEASCPDKICEKQGKISENGETITCLPNRVMVMVVAEGEGTPLDVIVK